jgi:hypothetical protein
MDGHGETSIPLYNFVVGGIINKKGGCLSYLTIFTFAVPELLDLI